MGHIICFTDHSQIEYSEIEKDFYEEHPEIAAMSEEKLRQIRKDLGTTCNVIEKTRSFIVRFDTCKCQRVEGKGSKREKDCCCMIEFLHASDHIFLTVMKQNHAISISP